MALHSKRDFSELCGIKSNELAVYIKRRKIILSGDFIDDTLQENLDFYRKRTGKEAIEYATIPEEPPNVAAPDRPLPKPPNVKAPVRESASNLDRELKVQQLEKIKADTEYRQIQVQKATGEVIPTELVKATFSQHSQSILTEFNNGINDILTLFAKKKGMTTNEIAEMRGELVGILNTAVNKAIALSKRNVSNIIKEYSLKKDVGQHD